MSPINEGPHDGIGKSSGGAKTDTCGDMTQVLTLLKDLSANFITFSNTTTMRLNSIDQKLTSLEENQSLIQENILQKATKRDVGKITDFLIKTLHEFQDVVNQGMTDAQKLQEAGVAATTKVNEKLTNLLFCHGDTDVRLRSLEDSTSYSAKKIRYIKHKVRVFTQTPLVTEWPLHNIPHDVPMAYSEGEKQKAKSQGEPSHLKQGKAKSQGEPSKPKGSKRKTKSRRIIL